MTSVAILAGEYLSDLLYLVLLLLPGLYWCLDPALGLRAMLLTMVSGGVNTGLKVLFQVPRLTWGSPLNGAGEQSYAFPSAHAEQTATALGWLACRVRTPVAFAAAAVLIPVIGAARVLAMAHTPAQVIAGTILGLILVAVLLVVDRPLTGWVNGLTMGRQLLAAIGGSVLLLALYPVCLAAGGRWPGAGSFLSELTGPLDPVPHMIWTGLFFGIASGAVLTNHRQGFPPARTPARKAGRLLWGLAGLLAIAGLFQRLAAAVQPPSPWVIVSIGGIVCGWWITAAVPAICRYRQKAGDLRQETDG